MRDREIGFRKIIRHYYFIITQLQKWHTEEHLQWISIYL
jgi:hypothetical protein